MILVITKQDDAHATIVGNALAERNAEYVCIFTDADPALQTNTISMDGFICKVIIGSSERLINLNDVKTVWYRRDADPVAHNTVKKKDSEFAMKEHKHFLRGLWHLSKAKFWVNPFVASQVAECKPLQLTVAQAVGLAIPKTMMTNDPEEALRFCDTCSGQIIYKPFSQYARKNESGGHVAIYTNRITRSDLEQHREEISLSPCIFQEYVPKACEVRVTVVGHRMFAMEIDAQRSARAKDDWRRYDLANMAFRPHNLPHSIQTAILNLLSKLELVFGCIDLILTPDGKYVFLEINPMGQWYWAEQLAGLPILDSFTEMLIQGTPNYVKCSSAHI